MENRDWSTFVNTDTNAKAERSILSNRPKTMEKWRIPEECLRIMNGKKVRMGVSLEFYG